MGFNSGFKGLNSSAFTTQCIYVFSIIFKLNNIISLRRIYLLVLCNRNSVHEIPFFMHSLCQHEANALFIREWSIMTKSRTTIKNNVFRRKFVELTLLLGTVLLIKMVNLRVRLDHVMSRLVQTNPRRDCSRCELFIFVTESVGPRFVDGGPPFYLLTYKMVSRTNEVSTGSFAPKTQSLYFLA